MNKREEIVSKLDLVNFIEHFNSFLAREKPLFMQGDTKIHYQFIKELSIYQNLKQLPSVDNLDTQIKHLEKSGILKIYEIYSFIKMIKYFLYLKKSIKEGSIFSWLEKIVIPREIIEICEFFDEKGNIKSSIDERFESIENSLARIKEQTRETLKSTSQTTRRRGFWSKRDRSYPIKR
jgi:DNA mismatch repair protein MutS2